MKQPIFRNFDPFVQILFLSLLCMVSLFIAIFMAKGLVGFLWGIDIFTESTLLTDWGNPEIININRLLLFFQHIGLFIVPAIIFVRLIAINQKSYLLGLKAPEGKFIIGSILLILFALIPINYLLYLNQQIELPAFFKTAEDSAEELTKALLGGKTFSILFTNLFVVALLPAIGEELIFRGLILKIVARWRNNIHTGIWVSAFIFSAMHMQFYGFVPRMLLGAVLGYIMIWSGSIYASMLAHFLNNAIAIVLNFLITNNIISDYADTIGTNKGDWIFVMISTILFSVLIYFMIRQSKWKSMKGVYFID